MRLRRLGILALLGLALQGCAARQTRLDRLFETDFAGLQAPPASWIDAGPSREFPGMDFERIWTATLQVCVQEGILVHASKSSGTLLVIGVSPMVLHVSRGDPVRIALNWMNELYLPADSEGDGVPPVPESGVGDALLFSKIQTQLSASTRWPYLTGAR